MKILFKNKINVIIFIFAIFLPHSASAATVYLETAHTEFFVGDTILVNVKVDSKDREINTVEGNISLDLSDIASVKDINLSESSFSLWPNKPLLSENIKNISFVGGIPSGLKSQKATLFKIVLNLKKAGQIKLDPADISVYLNDGKGTKDAVIKNGLTMDISSREEGSKPTDDWENLISSDKTPPEPFDIYLGQDNAVFDGKKFLSFSTTDGQSGIKYYEVIEGNLPPARSNGTYVLNNQDKSGEVTVIAYDTVGNERKSVYNPQRSYLNLTIIIVFVLILLVLVAILKKRKGLLILSLFFFLFFSGKAEAATLFIRPSQAEVTVGNIVTAQIYVDTSGKVINNAESIVEFPRDLLEVVSIDKTSIFSLWVEEPSFSNNIGQLNFNGGVPNPGFQGNSGKIISVTFRTKKVGAASIVFSSAAVRENDGLGTDILSSKTGSTITIVSGANQVQKIPDLVITSPSHPRQNSWYNENDVELLWTLPKNAKAVRTLLNTSPDSIPTVYNSGQITSKSIENVGDGIWYFHVNYLADGVWSKTSHYKLQIDTASPTDLRAESKEDEAGKVILDMKAGDSLSGIDHFIVTVNSDKPIVVKSDVNGEASMEVPFSRAGEHAITISAFDKAGNKTEIQKTIISDFVAELRIDSYPAKIKLNESIEISGTAPYPYVALRVSLKDGDNVVQTYKIKSNSYSKFNFISQPIPKEGSYTLWVDMLRDNEEVSISSQKVTISVETPLLLQIGSYTIGLMKVLIPAAILIIIFLLIVLYGWYKFFILYRKVKKEGREAKRVIEKSFDILRKDVSDHAAKIKRAQINRKLTSEETDFLEHFEEELSEAEEIVVKEVQDISNKKRRN